VNVTWRQEVGSSSIEAGQIAGHTKVQMTSEYTYIALERRQRLTRRTREQLEAAAEKVEQERKQHQAMAASAGADDFERFMPGVDWRSEQDRR
jgi:YD repeat-containing protein